MAKETLKPRETLQGKQLGEIESLLEAGMIYGEMAHGRYWQVRRNGATKLWKTRPNEYRIPIKAGLKVYGYIEPTNLTGFWLMDNA